MKSICKLCQHPESTHQEDRPHLYRVCYVDGCECCDFQLSPAKPEPEKCPKCGDVGMGKPRGCKEHGFFKEPTPKSEVGPYEYKKDGNYMVLNGPGLDRTINKGLDERMNEAYAQGLSASAREIEALKQELSGMTEKAFIDHAEFQHVRAERDKLKANWEKLINFLKDCIHAQTGIDPTSPSVDAWIGIVEKMDELEKG